MMADSLKLWLAWKHQKTSKKTSNDKKCIKKKNIKKTSRKFKKTSFFWFHNLLNKKKLRADERPPSIRIRAIGLRPRAVEGMIEWTHERSKDNQANGRAIERDSDRPTDRPSENRASKRARGRATDRSSDRASVQGNEREIHWAGERVSEWASDRTRGQAFDRQIPRPNEPELETYASPLDTLINSLDRDFESSQFIKHGAGDGDLHTWRQIKGSQTCLQRILWSIQHVLRTITLVARNLKNVRSTFYLHYTFTSSSIW